MPLFRKIESDNIDIIFCFDDSGMGMSTIVVSAIENGRLYEMETIYLVGVNSEEQRIDVMNRYKSKYNI